MFANGWRRGRAAALSAVCVAGLLGVGAGVAGAASAASAGTPVARVQAQARVPWSQVGPGWTLVEYTNGTIAHHAATTLYVVSPAGAKYPVYTWRASVGFAPGLAAWSGDKTRALFFDGGVGQMAQLNLLTGNLTRFTMQDQAQVIGYTRPNGLNILGVIGPGAVETLARFSLTGKLLKVLAVSGNYSGGGVDSADGTTLAVAGSTGLRLISNTGAVIRKLPVPRTDPTIGCNAVRWWDSKTILAGCAAKSASMGRLWLVPASGATPTPLTPQRKPGPMSLGDLDAWQLNSGLYLQSATGCGTVVINKQNANGSLTRVNVPGTLNANNRVLTARGQSLLVDALTACPGTSSLLWFNPGTRAEKWLIKAPAGAFGVLAVVPFYSTENAASF
jgi:TolB protein